MERNLGRLRRNSERFRTISSVAPYLTDSQIETLMRYSTGIYVQETVEELVTRYLSPKRIATSLAAEKQTIEKPPGKSIKEKLLEKIFPREYSIFDKKMTFGNNNQPQK